jgi:hypothetical protein
MPAECAITLGSGVRDKAVQPSDQSVEFGERAAFSSAAK